MIAPGSYRAELSATISAAYEDGLLSDRTLAERLEWVRLARLIEPEQLVGDLTLRTRRRPAARELIDRLWAALTAGVGRREAGRTLLALDWSGPAVELLVGRGPGCDVVLGDADISRRHAQLACRDGRWIVRDLGSRNGTWVNGARVGRCELRPGDEIQFAGRALLVD